MEQTDNPQLKLAFDFVQYTNKNIFLTGKAGTGKTTFLRNLRKNSPKRMIVVAPTGVAAINAGGVTIHSFFQMPFGPHIPEAHMGEGRKNTSNSPVQRFSREKIEIMRTLDLLVIDEISMVRADLLDGIDDVLRRFRERSMPFGGVQLLMIGDLQQLAPVIKDDEWNLLRQYYDTIFFFSSHALKQTDQVSIELRHIYRQHDQKFISILNKIRDNSLDTETLLELNKRYQPDFLHKHPEGYITLTTHNYQAQQINEKKLQEIDSAAYTYKAALTGDFPEFSYPTDFELTLKKGAQVMFVKNDSSREKLYYNGKIGRITDIEDDMVYVKCEGDEDDIAVERTEWQNCKYTMNEQTKEIEETVAGTFNQYPLKLAWAITIHKSQGLTFEKAIIDANAAFAHGQVYVALSRCKTLEGMVLSSRIGTHCIKHDFTVSNFIREAEKNSPGQQQLNEARFSYQKMLVHELFNFTGVEKKLSFCLKIIRENSSSIHNYISDAFSRMSDALKAEITLVAEKFNVQELKQMTIQQNNLEENEFLQERIKKASTYFHNKMELVRIILFDLNIDIDNKTVKKIFHDAVEKLREEIIIKAACLTTSMQGFTVKKYLESKAKASIILPETKSRVRKEDDTVSGSIKNPELYEKLRSWRKTRAAEENIPVFLVFSQKALIDLCDKLPVTLKNLKEIHGLGKKKIKAYGSEIIRIISEYCSQKGYDIPDLTQETDDDEKPKAPKKDTKKVSFELFKSGKTFEEIAAERGFAVSTIEGHLAHYVETGDLDIHKLVQQEKIEKISKYFSENPESLLGHAKEALGDEFSYGEIKLVLSYLKFKQL